MPRDRTYLWLAAFILLLGLPFRFARLTDSFWLDEAWVANSLLQPSLREVFYTTAWTQTSPPLFLLIERWVIGALGPSEVVFRLFPLVAGLAGLVLTAWALRRWFSTPVALLGVALLAGNYYLAKYSQQLKQYGSDFLVSAALLLLLGYYLENATPRRLAALLCAVVGGMYLSYTTVFWIPGVLVGLLLPAGGLGRSRFIAAGVLAPAFVTLYLVFVRPNRTEALARSLEGSYLDVRHPLTTLHNLLSTVGALLVPGPRLVADIVGTAVALVAVYAASRTIASAAAANRRNRAIILAGGAPLICVLAAGALHLYPVLNFPRMLLFALPSLALLLAEGANVILGSLLDKPVLRVACVGICALAVVASQAILFRYPRPTEENRVAMALLESQMAPADLLFVQGGMYEQFKYYRNALGFQPEHLYIGSKYWPCCSTGGHADATDAATKDFAGDLLEAAARARGRGLWLLFPSGTDGHWSGVFGKQIAALPVILSQGGCQRVQHRQFGQTLVESYNCGNP